MEFDVYPGKVLVHNLEAGMEASLGGVIIGDPTGKSAGIRSRWGQVLKVGPGVNAEIKPGLWILIPHGRWTRGIEINEEILHLIDTPSIQGVSLTEVKPNLVPTGLEAVKEYQYDAGSFRDFAGQNFNM